MGDWPDLLRLSDCDPAFIRRLALLPARARFPDTASTDLEGCGPGGIHQMLDQLSPALARLMLESFLNYKREGSTLLPVPASMEAFKSKLMVCTAPKKAKNG